MAKHLVSAIFLLILASSLILSSVSHAQIHSADNDDGGDIKYGSGSKFLNNIFNPLTQHLLQASLSFSNDLTSAINTLGTTSGLSPQLATRLRSTFQLIEAQTVKIKQNYSFFITAIFLWPIAFLLLAPVGCCISCLACCILAFFTLAVCMTAFIIGLLLYSGPVAGDDLPVDAAKVMASLVDMMAVVAGESMASVGYFTEKGFPNQAAPILTTMQSIIAVFGSFGQTLQNLLQHPQMTEVLSTQITLVYDALLGSLASLGHQTGAIITTLPMTTSASINGTLMQMAEQIQETIAKLS